MAADLDEVQTLARLLAPDTSSFLRDRVRSVPPADLESIAGPPSPVGHVVAIARRPPDALSALLERAGRGPVVLLDAPRHLGNVGAAIRVSAAAEAEAVATTGTADPWHATAVRGAAGLQFALPVGRLDSVEPVSRPIVALDPAGDPFAVDRVPPGAVLAFGSERRGLGSDVREAAVATLALPMREGVSSVNLAAAVAAVLYSLRLAAR